MTHFLQGILVVFGVCQVNDFALNILLAKHSWPPNGAQLHLFKLSSRKLAAFAEVLKRNRFQLILFNHFFGGDANSFLNNAAFAAALRTAVEVKGEQAPCCCKPWACEHSRAGCISAHFQISVRASSRRPFLLIHKPLWTPIVLR